MNTTDGSTNPDVVEPDSPAADPGAGCVSPGAPGRRDPGFRRTGSRPATPRGLLRIAGLVLVCLVTMRLLGGLSASEVPGLPVPPESAGEVGSRAAPAAHVDPAPIRSVTRGIGAPMTEESDLIQCANLIYAGTRSSVCFSDHFLMAAARESTLRTARKFKAVKLGSEEVFRYPFAVMTGEGNFSLTEAERVNLRHYLERGGFLLASAGCSSAAWDRSFLREMQRIFPERELEPIPADHEIFRTVHRIDTLRTRGKPAVLRGLALGGKLVVVYSSDGLNDTDTMQGCCCCGGNEILNARQVNVNILAYALVQ